VLLVVCGGKLNGDVVVYMVSRLCWCVSLCMCGTRWMTCRPWSLWREQRDVDAPFAVTFVPVKDHKVQNSSTTF